MSKKKKRYWLSSTPVESSAFDDVWGWWRADEISGSSGSYVLADKSGNSRTMTQAAGTITPGTISGNGNAKLTGNATARFTCPATIKSWPVTMITIGRRTAGATCGFFGHTGASGFNGLWYGYEASNSHRIYNTNSTNNATSDGGSDACWVGRVGWGSRVSIVNGIIQANQPLASIVRSSAVAVELGTQYRGLNLDWYETLVWDRLLSLEELDEVHTYINTRYGMSIPLWSSYAEAKVIRLRGQSNASGRGDRGASDANIPAEYDAALTGVNVWNDTVTSLIASAFSTLNINNNNHMLGENGTASNAQTYIGPEITLCKEYLDRVGGAIYLHKWALGGTMLEYTGSAPGHWDPNDETMVHSNSNRHFGNDMRNWWLSLIAHQTASRRPVIVGDVWFQGEQDGTVEANANAYSANLQAFYSLSDAEQGVTSAKKLICRVHTNGTETYKDTVRAQQALAAAAIPNAQLIDTDSYGTRAGDGVHLSVSGQLALGTHLASLL